LDNQWPIYHAYNKLARRGIVDPLTCHLCRETVQVRIGKEDEPVFWCQNCEKLIKPGLNTYEAIRNVVLEHEEMTYHKE
jgi:hypothetical protein